jgi:hypothetical protein
MTTLNLNQSAAAILLQQFNADNGTNWTPNQVTFSEVMLNNDVDAATYEAVIKISAVPGQGLNGSIYYKYNRIDLSTIFAAGNSSYDVDSYANYQALLTAINAAVGTDMQLTTLPNNDTNQLYVQGDIMPAQIPYPPAGKSSVQFVLTADPLSMVYRNSAILTATSTSQNMAGAVTTPSTGLVYTAPSA